MPVKGIQVFPKVNSQKVGIEYRRAGLVDDDDAVGIGVGIELDTQFRGTHSSEGPRNRLRKYPLCETSLPLRDGRSGRLARDCSNSYQTCS